MGITEVKETEVKINISSNIRTKNNLWFDTIRFLGDTSENNITRAVTDRNEPHKSLRMYANSQLGK